MLCVALVALALGAILAIAPGTVPSAVAAPLLTLERALDPELVVLAIGVLVGLFALWRSYFSGASDVRDGAQRRDVGAGPATDAVATASPSADAYVSVVGQATTERVERSISALERGRSADTEPVRADVRETLTAVETARGRPPEEAAERVASGAWTGDRIAATFLGDERAGRLTIWHRLRAWFFPGRTFQRRLERTLVELERHADARTVTGDGGSAGPSSGNEGGSGSRGSSVAPTSERGSNPRAGPEPGPEPEPETEANENA